jgi:hypothetical protein
MQSIVLPLIVLVNRRLSRVIRLLTHLFGHAIMQSIAHPLEQIVFDSALLFNLS